MRRIYLVNGKKMAQPINSKEEYFNLRNSAENRSNLAKVRQGDEQAKHKLVQIAYNDLMPDGKVEGACHPSSMFAYDVDCASLDESNRIAKKMLSSELWRTPSICNERSKRPASSMNSLNAFR